jgi:hypothetical protein
MKNNAYTAYGENPLVLCSYGTTPGKAMKEMGKLVDKYIKESEDSLVLGMNSMYDEDGIFCMNVTLSIWK